MQFRTQIPILKSDHQIDYHSNIVSLGSCFAVNMGGKLDYFKFSNTTNPIGILFHPLALEKFLYYSLNQRRFTEKDIFFYNERWHCFDAHSDLSNPDKETLLNNLNTALHTTFTKLKEASHLVITLGTAWVYTHIESGDLVANCHKVPQKQFSKGLLSTDVIKESLYNLINDVKAFNPNIHIIFTISPVRHIKDGFTENLWSKSNLITALQDVLNTQKSSCSYFPSYEIMMDELRDYRFYAEDMIHPNSIAIDYIWERFTDSWITTEALATMKEADNIQKGLQHRSFNPESQQHRDFLAKLNLRIAQLQQKHPHIFF
jgi:hypothetical protein